MQAIICGRVGQSPVQKILRNGRTVTIFTVGTGGMFDQRLLGKGLPRPVQWHRIAVHSDALGAYAVKQIVKKYVSILFSEMNEILYVISLMLEVYRSSSVYVEGDIETRVYNDGINGEVKNIPEICIRHDGIKPRIAVIFFSKCLSCKLYFFILQYLD